MSEFDKEAEREKLREKYERDQEKRETTERMSELLLKGATMTNRHCDSCGDPIFRYQGTEFCPTCQETAAEAGAGGEAPDANAQQKAGSAGDVDSEPAADAESDVGPEEAAGQTGGTAARGGARRQPPSQQGGTGQGPAAGRGGPRARSASPGAGGQATAGDLGDARAALSRALTRHANAAAETDDPRRARDHLAAAREAAEALAALGA